MLKNINLRRNRYLQVMQVFQGTSNVSCEVDHCVQNIIVYSVLLPQPRLQRCVTFLQQNHRGRRPCNGKIIGVSGWLVA